MGKSGSPSCSFQNATRTFTRFSRTRQTTDTSSTIFKLFYRTCDFASPNGAVVDLHGLALFRHLEGVTGFRQGGRMIVPTRRPSVIASNSNQTDPIARRQDWLDSRYQSRHNFSCCAFSSRNQQARLSLSTEIARRRQMSTPALPGCRLSGGEI